MLGPCVRPGMTVLDVGCGMGFFSLGLARLVGEGGRVISVDLQPQMLRVLERRARRKGLAGRIETRLAGSDGLGIHEAVDFALCFWMVHEVGDQAALFGELFRILRPGGHLFVAEPSMHVRAEELEASVKQALTAGFEEVTRPGVRLSAAVVLKR
ncbi:MAG: class I SAM-dependent methyltransferase [bacterium]|nr:MAG: class I SAM-dependent methyltransferase [bacterium]